MPGNTKDRKWRGEVVKLARDMLAEKGINLSNADLQATIWYPEKTLWKRMGNRGPRGGNADYSDAMQLLALNKGVDRGKISGTIKREIKGDLEAQAASAEAEDEEE